jgi:hypothetical protein
MSDRERGIPANSESGQSPSLASATKKTTAWREAPGAEGAESGKS